MPAKVHSIKAMVFPVVMYRRESWTIKKAECWRTDAFKLWCWRRLFRVPWTARSNQSILKEINPKYSLERLMPKLKLQYFGHLMKRANSLKKTLMLGKTGQEEKEATEDEMIGWHHWFNRHELGQTPRDGEGQGSLGSMRSRRIRHDLVTEWQQQKRSGLEKSMRESRKSLGVYSHKSGRDHMRQCEE